MLSLLSEATTVEQKVHLDVGILTFIIGVLLPLLTGLVTKANASPKLKALTLLSLSLIASAVQYLISVNGVVNLRTFLANFAVTWLIAISTYFGFTKPTGAAAKAQNVAPNIGLG